MTSRVDYDVTESHTSELSPVNALADLLFFPKSENLVALGWDLRFFCEPEGASPPAAPAAVLSSRLPELPEPVDAIPLSREPPLPRRNPSASKLN